MDPTWLGTKGGGSFFWIRLTKLTLDISLVVVFIDNTDDSRFSGDVVNSRWKDNNVLKASMFALLGP